MNSSNNIWITFIAPLLVWVVGSLIVSVIDGVPPSLKYVLIISILSILLLYYVARYIREGTKFHSVPVKTVLFLLIIIISIVSVGLILASDKPMATPTATETLIQEKFKLQNNTSILTTKIHGTVYEWNSFKTLNNTLVEVNSTPVQYFVATDGKYSFNLTPGTYIITAYYLEGETAANTAKEEIVISGKGDIIHDLILYPTSGEELINESSNSSIEATIHGAVYEWNNFKTLNNTVVEVNSTPDQYFVATDGKYSFNLTPGTYLISAHYLEGNKVVCVAMDEVVISEKMDIIHDLILFPPYYEELLD